MVWEQLCIVGKYAASKPFQKCFGVQMSFLCIELFMGTDINVLYIPTVFSILLLYIYIVIIYNN